MAKLLPGGGPSPAEVRKATAAQKPPRKPGFTPSVTVRKPGFMPSVMMPPEHHLDVTPVMMMDMAGIHLRLGSHSTAAHDLPSASDVRHGLSEPTQWGQKTAPKKPKPNLKA